MHSTPSSPTTTAAPETSHPPSAVPTPSSTPPSDATLPGVIALRAGGATALEVDRTGDAALEISAHAIDGLPSLQVEVELGAAVAYWRPGGRDGHLLPPDWAGTHSSGLVDSAPAGALYDDSGTVLFAWAAGEAVAELIITAGVSEERKIFTLAVRPARPLSGPLQLVLDTTGDSLPRTLGRLAEWMSQRVAGAALPVPPVAHRPVYSTWYTFTQSISDALVLEEAGRAAELGCGSVFIDDGWQRLAHGRGYQGCGDWVPDRTKFPDLPGTVSRIHRQGLGVALWVAPLLLGAQSDAYSSMAPFAPQRRENLSCSVLDPRHPEVRTFVVETCLRLVTEYGADLLKIDFLEQAMVYRDAPPAGDIADVGEAMAQLLGRLREALVLAGRAEVVFEFRQPYVSPAVARFGQILRAGDCPADSIANRTSTIDARLFAAGQIVHADPMMWGPTGGAEAAAQQLYAGWFSVPQISMRLTELPARQLKTVRNLLQLWRDHAELVLHGDLVVTGAQRGYDTVAAVRPDLGRAVIARYAPQPIELGSVFVAEVTILNATAEASLLVRTPCAILGGSVRTADGTLHSELTAHAPGLVDLAVPPWGRVSITLEVPAGAPQRALDGAPGPR
ncbi:glycoside hydrolase family 36 protein [Brachybacterium sp. YJGR34]|uniref:glycoside hydrolase family 36 protein n=1 Tax=Brachybacterium sp. YJGR34 TaxID=2059911 RepID=UPI000E0B868A|nr:glycoside hydrolase family 36 protein [Brachybacterium sp. YJGR34]